MEAYTKLVVVALVVLAATIGIEPKLANGESICGMTEEGFKACKPSVRSLNPVPPSAACCFALSNADMKCLCSFKNSKFLVVYGIDFNQAMQLPAKCNLKIQSFHC